MKKTILIISLIAISLINGFSQSVDLKNGLVAFYPFNGNANDESGNGNNGHTYNVSLSSDRNGKSNSAYYFNGDNAYIDLGSFSYDYSITYAVWIKTTDSRITNPILSKRHSEQSNSFTLLLNEGKAQSYVDASNYAKGEVTYSKINDGNWHFIVATKNGSSYKIYVDGTYKTSFNESHSISSSNSLHLGHHGAWDGSSNRRTYPGWFSGYLDDLRLYNRELNSSEIQALCIGQSEETVNPPVISWENPYNYNSNTEQGNYKIKACIKSKKQLSTLQIYINNSLYKNVLERGFNVVPSGGCDFVVEQDINLSEGNNQIKIIAANQGGSTTSDIRTINYQPIKHDNTPPTITLINPQVSRGFKQIEENEQINILGKAADESGIFKVTVNGTNASVSADGTFQTNVLLAFGDNTVTVKATDTKQNTSEFTFYVNRKSNQVVNNVVVNVNNSNNVNVNINERRIALVIGNGDYISAPLRNPVNDANTISAELKKLGFEVTTVTNGSQNQMKQAISNYGTQLSKDKNIVGLFYYAGHGIQVKGKNYIIPTDAKIEKEPDVEVFCVDLDGLLANLEYAGNNMNVIILDACRNNPFGRGFRSQAGNGLATVNAPTGTFIAFATAPGSTASDGEGNNGLYTQEFVKALQIPNIKIEDVFKKVRTQVKTLSNGQQIPWENSSIEGDFYFKK